MSGDHVLTVVVSVQSTRFWTAVSVRYWMLELVWAGDGQYIILLHVHDLLVNRTWIRTRVHCCQSSMDSSAIRSVTSVCLSVCLSVSICLCSICLFDCLCASITSIASVCLSVSLSVCVHQSRSVFSVGSDLNVFLLNTSVSMYSKCYVRIWKCSTAVVVIVHMCQSASTDVFATVTDFSG